MNSLEKIIEEIKEETSSYTELEKIRYVYLKLGLKMTFDLSFAFGTEKEKNDIYRNCFYNIKSLNANLENETIICRSLAYLLEYILKELGINISTIYGEYYSNNYPHVYNLVQLENKETYKLDLQNDLDYIQAHLRTTNFCIAINNSKNISREEIEAIDLKIGYISKEKYYADDHYYLVKTIVDPISNIDGKIEFILNNISPYDDYQKMRYGEIKTYFVKQLYLYLTPKEKRKIQVFDMYNVIENEKVYTLCFILDKNSKEKYIYLYNNDNKLFESISIEEFQTKIENGLHSVKELPKLKRIRN